MHSARRDDDIEFQSPTSGQVQAQAARSVTLLNAIEAAVTRAHSNATLLSTLAEEMEKASAGLAQIKSHSALDPEGRANDLLKKAAAAAARIHEDADMKMHSARADGNLTCDDGVDDAYAELADAAAAMHNAVEVYRDVLETIEALDSPVGDKLYTEPGDIFADIFSGR